MSGSTLGGIVGGTIGFFVGSPQLGWMIGSAIGGYLDPDQIEGPRLKDAQVQTSQEGVPRPIVYGTAQVAGNLIQRGPLVERRKKERAGKGGPEQITYHYYMTYAIRVCEGPIAGIRRIWRDDKLVYSLREGDVIDADTAAFASKLTIYTGSETQLPDPSLEALPAENGGGAGNVPSYRGTAYVVFENDDLTERRGTVPQYRFEVVSAGIAAEDCGAETGLLAWYPLDDAVAGGNARELIGGYDGVYSAGVTAGGALVAGGGSSAYFSDFGQYMMANLTGVSRPASVKDLAEWTVSCWCRPTGINGENTGGVVLKSACGYYNNDWTNGHKSWQLCLRFPDTPAEQKHLTPRGATSRGTGEDSISDPAGAVALGETVFMVMTFKKNVSGNQGTCRLYVNGELVNEILNYENGTTGATHMMAGSLGAFHESYQFIGNVQHVKYYGLELTAQDVAQRYRRADEYLRLPDSPKAYVNYDGGLYFSGCVGRISPDSITVAQIVTDLCSRVGIPTSKLDTSQLTGIVAGFVVARQMPASEAIRSLQRGYRFDMPEWDKKLRGIKRGGAIKDTITDAALVGDEEETRAQALEYPRKFNLIVSDPDANYEAVTITSSRSPAWVASDNQTTVELPIIFTDADEREQVCHILHKVAWTEMAGRLKIELPEEWTWLTPSDCFAFHDKRWRTERVEILDGSMKVEAVRDRASAYTSNATGVARNPTGPVSSIRGPTLLQVMNLPSLRTQDNQPGVYAAVTGLLPAWDGCTLELSVDGGTTFQAVATIISRATMGELTNTITDSSEPIPVYIYDNRELDSITTTQLDAGFNAFAIGTDDVWEVGQFQTATEGDPNQWDLTDTLRGQLDTTAAAHGSPDPFVLLDEAVQFIPIDASFAGETLIFRAVTFGTAPANNEQVSVVFEPPTFVIDGGEVT